MGDRARARYLERTTPAERLDAGLRTADEFIEAVLDGLEVPEGLTEEERVRFEFRALRDLGS